MTTIEELKDILKQTLEEKGVLNKIRAEMRKNIFDAIESDKESHPPVSDETLLINELILEYMNYNNYLHSKAVFECESGHPKENLGREYIGKRLNITETTSSRELPLLYSLIFGLKKGAYIPPGEQENNIGGNIPENIGEKK